MPILAQRQRRLVKVGEIRVGEKRVAANGHEYPASRDTFRFTSRFKDLLEALQMIHGGELRPWKAKVGHWELLSEAVSIPAYFSLKDLPDGDIQSLARNLEYRNPKDGTLMRRCDGETCTTWNGKERIQRPCLCRTSGEALCKVRSRVSVILPEVPEFGSWQLGTSSDTFESEALGFIDTMQMLGVNGLIGVRLTLTFRHKETAPGEKAGRFPVVMISHEPDIKPIGQFAAELGARMKEQPKSLGDLPAAPALPENAGDHDDEESALTDDAPESDTCMDAELIEEGCESGSIDPVANGEAQAESVGSNPTPSSMTDGEWAVELIGLAAVRDWRSAFQGAGLDFDQFINSARTNGVDAAKFAQAAQRKLDHSQGGN